MLQRLLLILTCALLLNGCAGRSEPAPVVELYQGKSYLDYEADTFDGDTYTVQKGDTLFTIAYFTGNDYRDLARYNKIAHPYNIFPGQTLTLVPSASERTTTKVDKTGQTRKTKRDRRVDPPPKQAYGGSENFVNNQNLSRVTQNFPTRVSEWRWPVQGRIVSRFSKSEQGNKGIDVTAERGTPILAAADGKVVYTGNALRGYGNLVIIKHTESYLSAYAHNDSVTVKEQQWVQAGQQIATMGDSGTDQVMLHFEVRYKGKAVDPLRYLPKKIK